MFESDTFERVQLNLRLELPPFEFLKNGLNEKVQWIQYIFVIKIILYFRIGVGINFETYILKYFPYPTMVDIY